MLGPRIISAVVLIPVVILLVWLGPETTALATGLGAIVGTYEFYNMAVRSPFHFHPLQLPGYIAAPVFSLLGYLRYPWLMLALIGILVLVTLPYFLLIRRPATVPAAPVSNVSQGLNMDWAITAFAPIYAGLPLGLVAFIRADRPNSEAIWWVLLICVGTWAADTGGYFFGRFFGKHKLAPKISPKKTVEGAIGGIAVSVLGVALLGGLALNIPIYLTLPLGLVLAVGSIIGDLFESWAKRRFDTKDSGKLIPGHGGLLDRIDSFLFVTVLVFIFMLFYV